MYDPLTVTGGFAAASTGVTLAALFPEATPAVVMCSLAGTALYVLSSRPHRLWRQVLFALVSFSSFRISLLYSRPDDLVADFFMGSGSTIKAALALGRRAIGVEMEKERFNRTVGEIKVKD